MTDEDGATCVLEVVLAAGSAAVRRALARVRRALMQCGLPEEACGRSEIVLAEALNNIVEHAYAGCAGGEIRLRLEVSASQIAVTLTDRGRALRGLDLPAGRRPDLDLSCDALPEGGFGWFLIRELSESLEYSRRDGCNFLTLRLPRRSPDLSG